MPTLSEVRAANWDHLRTNAAAWRNLGRTWESAFTEVHNSSLRPGGTDWTGAGAEAFQDRAYRDLVKIRGPVDIAENAAGIAERGADAQDGNKSSVLDAVDEAERDNFQVGEDYSVTDRITWYSSAAEQEQRELAAQGHSDFIHSRVFKLVGDEDDIARNLTTATTGLHEFSFGDDGEDGGAGSNGQQPHVVLVDDVLRSGESRNLGPVAGTGANPGVPGIGAADLGEVVTLPNGKQVMILGDSFSGDKMGVGDHYPSAAVPVRFENGKMVIDGPPLTGPDGSNVLFVPPPQAAGTNTLPAGSIRMRDGTTYMMVAGTDRLNPTGGSWLTKATNDPAQGWQPIDGSWREWTPNAPPSPENNFHPGTASGSQPSQISGYQAADGNVYIAADSFDRSLGVGMYRVDADHVTDRGAWQPWNGNGWGDPGQVATAPISPLNARYGELSFQDVGGSPVLSGFNGTSGSVDLHVGETPTAVFDGAPTVVAPGGHWDNPVPGTYPQNYGGYILPGSTLDDMGILVSQWNTDTNTPYVVEQFQVNPNR